MYGGIYAIIGLIILVIALLVQFTIIHKKREAKEELKTSADVISNESDLISNCSVEMEEAISTMVRIYRSTIDGVFKEDRKLLSHLQKEAEAIYLKYKNRRHYEVVPTLKRIKDASIESEQFYIQIIDYFYEISKALKAMTEASFTYINDNHEGFSTEQMDDLNKLSEAVIDVSNEFVKMLQQWDYSGLDQLKPKRQLISDLYALATRNQIKRAKSQASGTRNSILYLSLLNETKIIAMQSSNLMKSQRRLVRKTQITKD